MATKKIPPALAAAAAPLPPSAMPIGGLIDAMFDTRERKRALEEQVKLIESEYAGLEAALMARLATEQTDKGSGQRASASITKTVTGNIVEFEDLCKFIKRTGYFHLFQRRLSDPAYRELLDAGKTVPGVEKFVKSRVNLRVL